MSSNTPVNTDPIRITSTTTKICRPFTIEVMVFAPASGFKIEVLVEKTCTPTADPIWKIVFDLYKKQATGTAFDQLVHVSFKGGTPVQQKGIEATAANGITPRQADVLINEVGPAVLQLQDASRLPPDQLSSVKSEIVSGASRVAEFALESDGN
jgi:hypothetical protein